MTSINEFCAALPKLRHAHEAKGLLLWFPRTGMVLVPHTETPGGWGCVVVVGDPAGIYGVGGYCLFVSNIEVETATQLEVPVP